VLHVNNYDGKKFDYLVYLVKLRNFTWHQKRSSPLRSTQ